MPTSKEAAVVVSKLVPKLISWTRHSFLINSNLTHSQVVTLMNLYELKSCPVSRIAKALGVSLPTVSGIVDRLVRDGYARRIYDKEDRRLVLIALTVKGEAVIKKIIGTIRKSWESILIHLTEEERRSYVQILKKVTDIISKEKGKDANE